MKILNNYNIKFLLLIFAIPIFFLSCKKYDNFVTYFNTYYNMERLMKESENEFKFQEEKVRLKPRVYLPEPEIKFDAPSQTGAPPFCEEFIVTQQKRQPVNIKLDSIIIKGSKILAKKPRGEYIQGSLYLMAKTYFYKEEWLPSQVKCGELIDKFPDGELSPDAHLLLSKGLLIQQKFYSGKIMLSRTVDIAWQLKRYDILSEAFRLQAELALFQDDLEEALRPYKQAIVQSDDGELKAKWQFDLAALLFRMRKFERAEPEFRKVHNYKPDYLTKFEAYLYQASSLARINRFDEAEKILKRIENDGKYEEWADFVFAEKMQLQRLRNNNAFENDIEYDKDALKQLEVAADSLYVGNPGLAIYYFEKGMDLYNRDEYSNARSEFAKARMTRSPAALEANQLFTLINEWDMKRRKIKQYSFKYQDEEFPDSVKTDIAQSFFELGRIHYQLKNNDSVEYYYEKASNIADPKEKKSARFLYAYSTILRESNPYKADSLLDVIIEYHPLTEYGKESMEILGYTEAFVIDTAAELYSSGTDLMEFGDKHFAIGQFWRIYSEFPNNKYAPRALYAIGWIYEKDFQILDSAKYYYDILIRKYPESEYAKDIQLTVLYLAALEKGGPLPDSLQAKKVGVPPKHKMLEEVKSEPYDTKYKKRDAIDETGLSPAELLRNPGKLLENAKGLIKDPTRIIKDIEVPEMPSLKDLPTSPSDILKMGTKDSTKSDLNIDSTKAK